MRLADTLVTNVDVFHTIRKNINYLNEVSSRNIHLRHLPKKDATKNKLSDKYRAYHLLDEVDKLAFEAHTDDHNIHQLANWSLHECCTLREGDIPCTGKEIHRL